MTGPADDGGKNEFASFLEDVAQEISERVQSLVPPEKNAASASRRIDQDRHILDWPNVADRMIDELR